MNSSLNTARWVCLVLLLATWFVYAPVRQFDFVNYDDPEYVTRNLHVRGGLTAPGVEWALTSREYSNWFPLTWLSHMLDCQWFGLNGGAHHLTNVALHAVAVLLLFAFLRRATKAVWPSALVAALFALHPLHVESVAWIAERKDLLNACFWFLTLWAYARYTGNPSLRRYVLVCLAFCLGLMTKPMIVTLPLVLLLLDLWPLRRNAPIKEKLPLFALSAIAAVVTYVAQQGSGAVKTWSEIPLGSRLENALVSYGVYILKTIWPADLAVFYPYPSSIPGWQWTIAALLIIAITAVALLRRRDQPYMLVGWLWYLGTLAPVIGLVQVGAQARADRYMYIPMTGLLIVLAWSAADAVQRWPRARPAVVALMVVGCISAAVSARAQLLYWRNSETLFSHALAVTGPNYVAEHNLGNALSDIPGRLPQAITHLQSALRLRPDSPEAHSDLGTALSKIPGRNSDAIREYEAAVRLAPGWEIPHNNLGFALAKSPDGLPRAVAEYQEAIRIKPGYVEAHSNLGLAWSRMPGHIADAVEQFQAAVRLQPDLASAHNNLANALSQMPGRLTEAIAEYQEALRLQPDVAQTHYNLGLALSQAGGRTSEAIAQFEEALRLQTDYADAHNSLGVALASVPGRIPDAVAQFEAAIRCNPEFAQAHYNLGVTLSKIPGRLPDGLNQLEIALRLKPDAQLRRIVDQMRNAR